MKLTANPKIRVFNECLQSTKHIQFSKPSQPILITIPTKITTDFDSFWNDSLTELRLGL